MQDSSAMSRALAPIVVLALGVGLAGGCDVTGTFGGGGPADDSPSDDDSSSCGSGGALPAPLCGEGGCSCCGSCDPARELCMTADWSVGFGYGHCRATPADGTMTATVDQTAFVATEVAAIADGAYLQVSGQLGVTTGSLAGLRQITIQAPAVLGTTDCVASPLIAISYAEGETSIRYNAGRSMPRPACSVTLTAIGEVGARIEGTFTVTVADDATKATTDITAGTFSVERGVYP
jgi:hypothetical protein